MDRDNFSEAMRQFFQRHTYNHRYGWVPNEQTQHEGPTIYRNRPLPERLPARPLIPAAFLKAFDDAKELQP